MDKTEAIKFIHVYRVSVSEGKNYMYQPQSSYQTMWNAGPIDRYAYMDPFTKQHRPGVKLDMSQEDFERLVSDASEGLDHRIFRDKHPAAQELYDQYMTMYILTRQEEDKMKIP